MEFGATFWALLPAFIIATLIGAIETVGDAIAIQKVSWRKRRAVDFREVQGAVTSDGLGNLLSGLVGTVPNTTYSSSIALVDITGVAARRVGIFTGALFMAVTCMPKAMALILAIPGPVAASLLFIMMCLLFISGIKMVAQGGFNHEKAIIVGVSFWVGVGFQNKQIFADSLSLAWSAFLENGMTSGGLVAILLTLLLELTNPHRKRMATKLNMEALPKIRKFLEKFVAKQDWNDKSIKNLRLASEETPLALVGQDENTDKKRHLMVTAKGCGKDVELEFIAATGKENLEDQMTLLGEQTDDIKEREVSLRLLQHVAASVHHQQYHKNRYYYHASEPSIMILYY